jgi:hypothetical protein
MEQQALERALGELILGPAIDPADRRAMDGWLERSGIGGDDADAIREMGLERLLVYRDLVRRTLRDVLSTMLPRTLARLADDAFAEYFDRFLAERAPRTHYLRDVTREFVEFCVPLWRHDPSVAAYLVDLARHEALEFELAAREDEPKVASASPHLDAADEPNSDGVALELDRPVQFIRACSVVHFDHAVHELDADVSNRALPQKRPTTLLGYRDAEHEVRHLELSPLACAIVERLLDQRTLSNAVAEGCAALGVAADPGVLDGLSRVLADLGKRGVLLGPL